MSSYPSFGRGEFLDHTGTPTATLSVEEQAADKAARQIIAEGVGHGRIEITHVCLGRSASICKTNLATILKSERFLTGAKPGVIEYSRKLMTP